MFYLLCFVALLLLVFRLRKRINYWNDRGIPTLELLLLRKKHPAMTFQEEYLKHRENNYPLIGINPLVKKGALILDINLVQSILVTNFSSFSHRDFLSNRLNDPMIQSILFTSGDQWRMVRKKIIPLLSKVKLQSLVPIVEKISDKLVMCIEKQLEKGNEIDLKVFCEQYLMDITGIFAFGLECNSLGNADCKFMKFSKEVLDISKKRFLMALLLHIFQLDRIIHINLMNSHAIKFFEETFKDTMAYRKENNVHREDIFNVLMDSYQKGSLDGKENFTFTNFLGNAMALFLANVETTSRLVQSCLLELAHNPEIQDRMRNEVRTILQKYNNKITYEAITEMTYVEQALYETMRKYPLLTFLSRNAAKDVKVLGSDVILEKGTLLLISVQGIHYNPDFYPDPEKYDPDRFTYEAIKSRPSCSFLGFGDGPRNCFGSKLGLLQGKLVITNILINYKISPSPKVPYPLRYKSTEYSVLMPDTGCWLIMEKI